MQDQKKKRKKKEIGSLEATPTTGCSFETRTVSKYYVCSCSTRTQDSEYLDILVKIQLPRPLLLGRRAHRACIRNRELTLFFTRSARPQEAVPKNDHLFVLTEINASHRGREPTESPNNRATIAGRTGETN